MKPKDVLLRSSRPASLNYRGGSISRPPTYQGSGGKVWTMNMQQITQRSDASVGVWLLYSTVNPMFDYYAAALLHLREIPGFQTPVRLTPEMAYEFYIFALDPNYPLPNLELLEAYDASQGPQVHTLDAAEVVAQFPYVGGDAQALGAIDDVMQAITREGVPPDEDYRVTWSYLINRRLAECLERPERTN